MQFNPIHYPIHPDLESGASMKFDSRTSGERSIILAPDQEDVETKDGSDELPLSQVTNTNKPTEQYIIYAWL